MNPSYLEAPKSNNQYVALAYEVLHFLHYKFVLASGDLFCLLDGNSFLFPIKKKVI